MLNVTEYAWNSSDYSENLMPAEGYHKKSEVARMREREFYLRELEEERMLTEAELYEQAEEYFASQKF